MSRNGSEDMMMMRSMGAGERGSPSARQLSDNS